MLKLQEGYPTRSCLVESNNEVTQMGANISSGVVRCDYKHEANDNNNEDLNILWKQKIVNNVKIQHKQQDNQGKENIKKQRKRFNEKKKEKQNEETTE